VLPGEMWGNAPTAANAAATSAASVKLLANARVRAGRTATVRWRASGATQVATWRVLLDGRRVGTVANGERSMLRKRISTTGRHRWKVVGLDAEGAPVVSAARSFRVVSKG
jgi:hypothetical protein